MSSGLYEELGIAKDATPEQVRKAYKKKALLTHPDRLQPTATAEEKAAAGELFRKVNNAYEVLNDTKKRKEYDIHGVWPPPQVDEDMPSPHWSSRNTNGSFHTSRPSRSQTFPDPFFSHGFAFTDPFALFEQMFEGTPFTRASRASRRQPRPFGSPFDPSDRIQADIEDFMNDLDRNPFGLGNFPRFNSMLSGPAFPAVGSSPLENNNDGRVRWVSQSTMMSTINGVTQSIHKRVDSEGNEHVTRTFPDGRQVRTINGVEQQPRGQLPYSDPSRSRRLPERSGTRYLPGPVPMQPARSNSSARLERNLSEWNNLAWMGTVQDLVRATITTTIITAFICTTNTTVTGAQISTPSDPTTIWIPDRKKKISTTGNGG